MSQQSKELEQLRKEFMKLSNRLSDLTMDTADELGERGENFVSEAREKMSEMFATSRDAVRGAKEKAKKANEFAHDNPWMVAAGATAIGVVLGMLLSHRDED